jgi:hypothetical protein
VSTSACRWAYAAGVGSLTEEAFRELLDPRGILRPGALPQPDRSKSYAIFAQRPDVRLDIEGLKRQADQFFATKIGMTVDKQYGDLAPAVDAARLVVSGTDGSASGTRLCYGRAVDPSDLAAAEEAERAIGTYGLALLAQRCKTIWTVVPETDDDRAALTIAAILASTLLGPILSPGGREIIGVRSARLKLEGRASPYR